MKILVTGANGYIGSHVTKELLNAGHKVIAVDIKADNIDKRATIKTDNIFSHIKKYPGFKSLLKALSLKLTRKRGIKS